jgi:O-acetyl-ADP-ribose deacetylase (regulator of RNase III)
LITKIIKKDLLTHDGTIMHGVNCQGVMGSGVAKAIRDVCPTHFEDYVWELSNFSNSKSALGFTFRTQEYSFDIVGAFTQEFYGRDGRRYVNYAAIAQAFLELSEYKCLSPVLGIPRIGAGLGGGDWNIIEQIINDATPEQEICLYEI